MLDFDNNLYIEGQGSLNSSLLNKRGNPFLNTEKNQNKKKFKVLLDANVSKNEDENLEKLTYVFQEFNYGSEIYPLEPLPFIDLGISFNHQKSLSHQKSKKFPSYSYDEIKYLQDNKNIRNDILIKLFCDIFSRKLNPMSFYRLKITCAYNPFFFDENGNWYHVANKTNNFNIKYDEELLKSFKIKKLKYEDAYKEYCDKYPNKVNFRLFSTKIGKIDKKQKKKSVRKKAFF